MNTNTNAKSLCDMTVEDWILRLAPGTMSAPEHLSPRQTVERLLQTASILADASKFLRAQRDSLYPPLAPVQAPDAATAREEELTAIQRQLAATAAPTQSASSIIQRAGSRRGEPPAGVGEPPLRFPDPVPPPV